MAESERGDEGGDLVEHVRDLASTAAAQARVVGRTAQGDLVRRRRNAVVGCVAAGTGLIGSVALAVAGGVVSDLWWLTIPTWIATATPILVLTQPQGDAATALAARTVGTADLAEGLRQSVEAVPAAADAAGAARAILAPLASIVERDVEATRRAMRGPVGADKRRHRRIVPRERRVIVTTTDQRRLRATIVDVSVSGVAMAEPLSRLSPGEPVLVGRTRARVVRVWDRNAQDRGIAFVFDEGLDPTVFDEEIVL